jgi:hypothetical protein
MLGGVDPLLVVVLKHKGVLSKLGNLPILNFVANAIGVPIPIYLFERKPNTALTAGLLGGIYVDSESRSIDLETVVETTTNPDPADVTSRENQVTQTVIDSQVTVNLVATDESILLTTLIALMELILKKLVADEYEIHYINKSTTIFGGRLHRFSTSNVANTNLINIEMVLSTATKKNPTPKPPAIQVPNGGNGTTPPINLR